MHTVWKGAISFGLVHVPVKMFSATEDKDISMRLIHRECGSPVAYVRKCQTCETDIGWDDIIKGYEYEKGHFVLFEKEELEQLSDDATKTITILDFVDLEEIDPIYFQKTYYLSPDQAGGNAYNLLLEAMRQSGRIGIAKVSIRSKSSLAAIRVIGDCIAMETIFYPDEIRSVGQVPGLPEGHIVNEKELTMARMLIEQLSTPFEPAKYTDDYRVRLMDLIQHKIAGEEVRVAPEQQRTNVLDLMAALQASLEAVRLPPGTPGSFDTGGGSSTANNPAAGAEAAGSIADGAAGSAAGGVARGTAGDVARGTAGSATGGGAAGSTAGGTAGGAAGSTGSVGSVGSAAASADGKTQEPKARVPRPRKAKGSSSQETVS
ncbi:Non-homologous end joining protein Ku [Paenibacillus plantiphilus]|uniref:Non-homologous end joining protein Ku n=1 Tax=Paenibacillus plantiphilus TaxID=2905650 RepID=A0ABM9CVP6_9BACL|nr:Ku protein [Paenibacillus plantiphilus]CAH1224032.1 Non-homologous end joining protein Ku [Paenibacillus plantiphilus]